MNGIGTWNLVLYLIDKLGVGGTPAAMAITMGGILLCMIIPYATKIPYATTKTKGILIFKARLIFKQ